MRPTSPTRTEFAVLTGDLLLYRFKGGKIQIRFADTGDPDLLVLARELLSCFETAAGKGLSRSRLEEELEFFRRRSDLKVVDGLIKLLMDLSTFSRTADRDYPALRRKVFQKAFEELSRCQGSWSLYRHRVEAVCGQEADLYGDLPGFETLLAAPALKPEELLCRYNLALAQGMLFFTDTLSVQVTDPDPAELRRMFKYLKFFRLLANMSSVDASSARFEISGPFSLFGTTRKYALNLAVFFPAVVRLEKWQISAKAVINGREGELILDHSSGLVSHYRNFSAYVPEEVKMFHRLFSQKITDWKIIGETPVLCAGKQEFVIPDLSFESPEGQVFHLELFHRWHRTQLEQRLKTLQTSSLPLIAGVDRSIMKNEEYEALLDETPALRDRLFRFSDFPGVETVYRLLKKQV